MKYVTFAGEDTPRPGLVVGETVIDLSSIAPDLLALIQMGSEGQSAAAALATSPSALALDDVRLLAPVPNPPRNVMCLGRNYAEHARESFEARGEKVVMSAYPVIFTKATTAINGPYDDVAIDAAVSPEMDYEAELAFVIGRPGKNISRDDAFDHIFGYMVLNDVTARDLQHQHKQFFKGKSLDGCCPTGPWLVTPDEIDDIDQLRVTCRVNDELRQDGNTREMIFDIPEIIHQLSRGMTLLPGDIIATGTPSGVGFARKPPVFLAPGDVVECTVENVGTIRNRIVID